MLLANSKLCVVSARTVKALEIIVFNFVPPIGIISGILVHCSSSRPWFYIGRGCDKNCMAALMLL